MIAKACDMRVCQRNVVASFSALIPLQPNQYITKTPLRYAEAIFYVLDKRAGFVIRLSYHASAG